MVPTIHQCRFEVALNSELAMSTLCFFLHAQQRQEIICHKHYRPATIFEAQHEKQIKTFGGKAKSVAWNG